MTRFRGGSGTAATVIALLTGVALAAFGVLRGTWAVGGSDSSCYALTALAIFIRNKFQRRW